MLHWVLHYNDWRFITTIDVLIDGKNWIPFPALPVLQWKHYFSTTIVHYRVALSILVTAPEWLQVILIVTLSFLAYHGYQIIDSVSKWCILLIPARTLLQMGLWAKGLYLTIRNLFWIGDLGQELGFIRNTFWISGRGWFPKCLIIDGCYN